MEPQPPLIRPRRLRLNPILREMVSQSRLSRSDFIQPIFVRPGRNIRQPIGSMPGQYQFSPDTALSWLKELAARGVQSCILFGVTDASAKDSLGSHAHDPENAVCQTLRALRDSGIDMLAITDLCYCEYTDHGHCGPLTTGGTAVPTVDNDAAIRLLAEQAVLHARQGADVVAPSAMMDGAVGAIRAGLDAAGYRELPILSYAVKYASSFYGPFRDAAESPPQMGDRRGYQMDFRRSVTEALYEAKLDVAQGADLVMVKPGLPYLDILARVAAELPVPCGVYHVSGEYAMTKAAAAAGWIDEKAVVLETMHAFKRAGTAFIMTYYAADLVGWV